MADQLRIRDAAVELGIPDATIRDIKFKSQTRHAANGHVVKGNGFALAFLKLGRAVYVDIPVFRQIWRDQQTKGASHG